MGVNQDSNLCPINTNSGVDPMSIIYHFKFDTQMKMFAKVLEANELPENTLPNGDVIPASVSYRLSVRLKSKLASASIYWLTLPKEDATLAVGDTEDLDSEDFYATEKTTKSGNTIKILKARGLEIL